MGLPLARGGRINQLDGSGAGSASSGSRRARTSRMAVSGRRAWAIQGVCELTEALPSAARTVA